MGGTAIGLLHPGQMGQSVGAALRAGGAHVLWASEDRSAETRARAEAADLDDAGALAELVPRVDVVVSVCPPHAAGELARRVLDCGFAGTYVDANAIAPETARGIARDVEAHGARFVDGGIVGPPALAPGTTRLYLSGEGAEQIAALFAVGVLEAIPIEGSASALKMAYAGWTKGSAALLMAIRALARREGVQDSLLAEWARSIPDLPARSEGALRATPTKAWRFVGEMHEIARALEDAGLPGGFHRAAAEVYERLSGHKDAGPAEPEAVLEELLQE